MAVLSKRNKIKLTTWIVRCKRLVSVEARGASLYQTFFSGGLGLGVHGEVRRLQRPVYTWRRGAKRARCVIKCHCMRKGLREWRILVSSTSDTRHALSY